MTGPYLLLFAALLAVSFVYGKEECNRPVDVAFLIDGSRSIYILDFEKQIDFTKDLLGMFNVGPGPNDTHVAALTFGRDVEIEFTFGGVATEKDAIDKTNMIDHPQGDATYTDLALKSMREDLFSPSTGARSNVPKICILITDGASTAKSKTLDQAEKAKAEGITIMAIGVGNVNENELEAIVSDKPEEHFFHAKNFDELKQNLKKIGIMTCKVIEEAPAPVLATTTTTTSTTATTTTTTSTTKATTETTTEEQKDEPKKTCQGKSADILFVIDESSSIWPVYFKEQLEFLMNLVSNFDIDSGKTKVGMLTFSDTTEIQFYFDAYKTQEEIKKAINATTIEGGVTNTHLALQAARTEVFTKEHGSRREVAHICITVTDGESREPVQTKIQAELLHKTGVDVFAIGVGNLTNLVELKNIASRPEFVFEVNGYQALKEIQSILASKTCEAVKPPQPAPNELKDVETRKICRGKSQDIMFVLDMSNSIWIMDFRKILDFLYKLVGFFDVDRGYTRVGMLTFSNDTEVQFLLNTFETKEEIQKAILAVEQLGGLTNTHRALLSVLEDLATVENGFRPNVDHTCIVMTDGISREPEQTKGVAKLLHDTGMEVIAIGMGDKVDVDELLNIASKPEFVFQVSDYDTLEEIKNMLARTTCEGFRADDACEAAGMDATIAFTALVEAPVNTGDVLIFDQVIFNINNGYDHKLGVFTAQTKGLYRFAFSVDFYPTSADVNVHLTKNNEVVSSGSGEADGEWVQSSGVVVLPLEEGDEMLVKVVSADDSSSVMLDVYSTFSGVFLHN